MKPRGQLIIDEFELLRSVSGKTGLKLPPELMRGRLGKALLRKRDLLFEKLGQKPGNQYEEALPFAIIYDQLYVSNRSAAVVKYGDNNDLDILVRFLKYRSASRLERRSDLYRLFIKRDLAARKEYERDKSTDRLRMRLHHAAKRSVGGLMDLTPRRKARLKVMLPQIRQYLGAIAQFRT